MQLQKNVVSTMVYPYDGELVSRTVPPFLQGEVKDCKPSLESVMSSVHGVDYGRDRQYTKEKLRALTPDGVVRWWMNLKTFGIPDPHIDANPTFAGNNTLTFGSRLFHFL